MGTIAFGASVLWITKILRILFIYWAKKFLSCSQGNCCCRCIVNCGECFLKCFERVCDYVCTEAFTYIAITSDPFC